MYLGLTYDIIFLLIVIGLFFVQKINLNKMFSLIFIEKDEENLIKPEYEPEPDFSNTSKSRPPRFYLGGRKYKYKPL